ncbi:hypothetical protein [Modestobacter sp. DSM 44400]|uniref:hypothetical protein n=1 Tax=Modestobacter sp. DSM 44400 TaxID=1550230 RepID=UPI001587B8F6|nr:hypothetical protein [Modestobacter sp. DSM 44400]
MSRNHHSWTAAVWVDVGARADLQTRHDIAVQFIAYEIEHGYGVTPVDELPPGGA